ncbi:MAG: hypothetical protein WC569_01725 [Candidatus Omnitrophota bacterium]
MLKRLTALSILLCAAMCLAAPLFAEEAVMPIEEDMLPAEDIAGEGVITGEILSLDPATGIIAVKGDDGAEKAFTVVDGETILWKGIEDIRLSDVKKGEKAEVGYYTDETGKLIASWVDVLVPEEQAAAPETITPVSAGSEDMSGEDMEDME